MSHGDAATSPRLTKRVVMLASIVLAVLTLLAWTQEWVAVTTTDGLALSVAGQVAAPALSALALTTLVLVGALSIAGPFFRVVFGVLEALIGVAVLFSAVVAIADPIAAAAPAISDATGVAGAESVGALVASAQNTAWPWVAAIAGLLIVAAGLATALTARRWPGATRKYQAARLEPAEQEAARPERSSVDDWDALSGGSDPTSDRAPDQTPPQPAKD